MAWLPKDAAAHNARLKARPKLQKLWADTANGTLRSEIEQGTAKDKAEGIAIATANKAVGKKLRTVTAAPSVAKDGLRSSVLGLSQDPSPKTQDLFRVRMGQLTPGSIDLHEHSVEAVLGTENAALSMDLATRKTYLEIYRLIGNLFSLQP
jgi:muconolactone delta-isomerase